MQSWILGIRRLVDERAAILDLLKRLKNLSPWHFATFFGADRRLFRVVIHFDCQYTLYGLDGPFGLRRSRRSRHAFNGDYRLLHVRCDVVARCIEAGDCLGKEEKNDGDDCHDPEHDPIPLHDSGHG